MAGQEFGNGTYVAESDDLLTDMSGIDPTLDSCCQREILGARENRRITAELRKVDPVLKAIAAKQVLIPASQLVSTSSSSSSHRHSHNSHHSHACDSNCSHEQHDPFLTPESSDLDDSDFDAGILDKLRNVRLQELATQQQQQQKNKQYFDNNSALPPLREVVDTKCLDELKAKDKHGQLTPLVVCFFFKPPSDKKQIDNKTRSDCSTMDGYLRQLALEFKDSTAFWMIPITAGDGWTNGGVLADLMLPTLPALACFRRSQLVNRCVGTFSSVFPGFSQSPVSVRHWLSKSGMLPDNNSGSAASGDDNNGMSMADRRDRDRDDQPVSMTPSRIARETSVYTSPSANKRTPTSITRRQNDSDSESDVDLDDL